jgi:hypothetical protein
LRGEKIRKNQELISQPVLIICDSRKYSTGLLNYVEKIILPDGTQIIFKDNIAEIKKQLTEQCDLLEQKKKELQALQQATRNEPHSKPT